MQNTDDGYKAIILDDLHWEEHKATINNVDFFEDDIAGISTARSVFGGDELTIGGAAMGSVTLTLRCGSADELSATIPRMAKIQLFTRLVSELNGTRSYSAWLPQGTYWIDSRDATAWSAKLSLSGYDAMGFAEADYPETDHDWPMDDIDVVTEIAQTIGVELDDATTAIMTSGYQIPLPLGYTMRETLGYIAAMYGGNFIITKENKLLLLGMNTLPEETNILIDSFGEPIVFGGGAGYEEVTVRV